MSTIAHTKARGGPVSAAPRRNDQGGLAQQLGGFDFFFCCRRLNVTPLGQFDS